MLKSLDKNSKFLVTATLINFAVSFIAFCIGLGFTLAGGFPAYRFLIASGFVMGASGVTFLLCTLRLCKSKNAVESKNNQTSQKQ